LVDGLYWLLVNWLLVDGLDWLLVHWLGGNNGNYWLLDDLLLLLGMMNMQNLLEDSEQLVSQLGSTQLCPGISQRERTQCICPGTLGERILFGIQLRSNQCIDALLGFGLFV
jgi:hypothetical protein